MAPHSTNGDEQLSRDDNFASDHFRMNLYSFSTLSIIFSRKCLGNDGVIHFGGRTAIKIIKCNVNVSHLSDLPSATVRHPTDRCLGCRRGGADGSSAA